MGIGIGDLPRAALFPLVMRKAFGRPAGVVALTTSLSVMGALLSITLLTLNGPGHVRAAFPVMI